MAKALDSTGSKKVQKSLSGLLKLYLISYNVASFAGWGYVLLLAIQKLIKTKDYTQVFEATWPVLIVVQSTALFEILHALLGWVRAPIMTTIMQVASRIFLIWAVNYPFPQIHAHWSYTTMVVSWCIAEVVRYSYYATNLMGSVPSFITWARYTFFLVLYPTGISSELIMTYQSLPYVRAEWGNIYYYLYIAVLALYLPGAPVLFNHMRVQRRKYLKESAAAKKTE